MKIGLLLLPAWLSLFVLAAHFLRAGNLLFVMAALALIVLLFVRRPWSRRMLQVGLSLSTLEWGGTLFVLVAMRRHAGEPFGRLAIILGSVIAVTAASALLLRTCTLLEYFRVAEAAQVDTA